MDISAFLAFSRLPHILIYMHRMRKKNWVREISLTMDIAVWNEMKEWFKEKYEEKMTYLRLRTAVQEAWIAINKKYLNDLINSMQDRCEAVIKADENHTKHWENRKLSKPCTVNVIVNCRDIHEFQSPLRGPLLAPYQHLICWIRSIVKSVTKQTKETVRSREWTPMNHMAWYGTCEVIIGQLRL